VQPDISAASVLGLDIPNFLPRSVFGANLDWVQPAGRLLWSSVALLLGIFVVLVWIRIPKRSAEPATWAATISGALLVWVLLILGYGVVPHEWLTFSSAYLDFGKNTFALQQNQIVPFDVSREAVAHVIVTGIYVFVLGVNVFLFAKWQDRKVAEPAAEGTEAVERAPWYRRRAKRTSAYGRPVTVQE
jgi:hypothetical protein